MQLSIADYLSSGAVGAFDSTVGACLLAAMAACAAIATASTVLMISDLSPVKAETFITVVSLSSNMTVLILWIGKDWPPAYATASIILILLGSFQFTLAVVKIAAYVPAEVNVVLYGAMWLVSMLIKAMLTSLVPLEAQSTVYAVIWFLASVGYAVPVICGCQHAQVVPRVVVASRTSELKNDAEHSISKAAQNEISVAEVQK